MAFLLNDCYFLKYNAHVPDDFPHDFYFPTEDTFDTLTGDDINVNKLVELAKLLLLKREEAWENV